MKVLVTGSEGFLGSAVATIIARHHEVLGHDIRSPEGQRAWECRTGDLSNWSTAVEAVADADAIVHLATGLSTGDATPASIMAGSVMATVNVFEAASHAGIDRIVLMSSGAVVVDYERGQTIAPDAPHRLHGLYPLSKSLQERVGEQYASEHEMTVPILRPWVVVDAASGCMKAGEPLDWSADPLSHNGSFGWVDRFDVADACLRCLDAPIDGASVFYLMATAAGRREFDMQPADAVLEWKPVHRFDSGPPDVGDGPSPPSLGAER